MAATSAVTYVALAAAAAGTAASVESSAQQSRLAGQAKNRTQHDQDLARKQALDQAEKDNQQAAQDQLRAKQKGLGGNSQGRAGTILSSPSQPATALGASSGGKTVLGA